MRNFFGVGFGDLQGRDKNVVREADGSTLGPL